MGLIRSRSVYGPRLCRDASIRRFHQGSKSHRPTCCAERRGPQQRHRQQAQHEAIPEGGVCGRPRVVVITIMRRRWSPRAAAAGAAAASIIAPVACATTAARAGGRRRAFHGDLFIFGERWSILFGRSRISTSAGGGGTSQNTTRIELLPVISKRKKRSTAHGQKKRQQAPTKLRAGAPQDRDSSAHYRPHRPRR